MKIDLLRALIARNVVTRGTEIQATYQAHDMSGFNAHKFTNDFVYVTSEDVGDTIILHLSCIRFGTVRKIPMENVVSIDGMPAERLAAVYNIGPDGNRIVNRGRRGRRRKGWTPEDDIDSYGW